MKYEIIHLNTLLILFLFTSIYLLYTNNHLLILRFLIKIQNGMIESLKVSNNTGDTQTTFIINSFKSSLVDNNDNSFKIDFQNRDWYESIINLYLLGLILSIAK